MNTKILKQCLWGTTLAATSVAYAGFFEFKEDSKLAPIQQNTLKVLFVDKAVRGISSMVSSFETGGVLADIILEYKDARSSDEDASLEDIILPYLLETSRKNKDLEAILKYDANLADDIKNAEKVFQEAITGNKDGLFNGIIRETLKAYKKCIKVDGVDDKEQLTEAYAVLWDTVVNAWTCDFSGEFWDNLVDQYPEAKLGGLLTKLREADGKNACQKIASVLGNVIKEELEKSADCCCESCKPCCKKTLEITTEATKIIIKLLPTITQLVVAIMTATA